MSDSNFPFVKNIVLRENLDSTFKHIIELLSLVESKNYNSLAKSSFRKTIIIHTASIIEALLFYVLDKKFTDTDIADYYSKWILKDIKNVYIIDKDKEKIVAGKYVKKKGNMNKEKLNLGQIAIFLQDKKIINKNLFKKVDFVRKKRNEQHLNAHNAVKKYSGRDLEEVFSVAKDVKYFVAMLEF